MKRYYFILLSVFVLMAYGLTSAPAQAADETTTAAADSTAKPVKNHRKQHGKKHKQANQDTSNPSAPAKS